MAGFVSLLGISHRQLRAKFDPKTCNSQNRNRIPVEPKTLGEWLHFKRIEADVSHTELARKLGVGERRVQRWGRNKTVSAGEEWKSLAEVLPLDTGLVKPI